jgi:hypothetical protein
MEPVTYLSGLSTLICSYLFFLYVSAVMFFRSCNHPNLAISWIFAHRISTTEKVSAYGI